MFRTIGWALAVSGLLTAGSGLADAAEPITVQLGQQNNSGESGTAVLTDAGPKTKVVIDIKGAPAGVGQPVHVHKGTCAQLDPAPAYGLTTLANGKSVRDDDRRTDRRPTEGLRDQRTQVGPGREDLRLLRQHPGDVGRS
jgi:hypothetical protein